MISGASLLYFRKILRFGLGDEKANKVELAEKATGLAGGFVCKVNISAAG